MQLLARIALLSLLLLLAPSQQVAAGDDGAETVARLGVLSFRSAESTLERWQPTADYLSRAVEGVRFDVLPMNYPELEAAIAAAELEFVLTNTGHYVQMEAGHGLTRLVTLIAAVRGEAVRTFGGVIFTRADHPTIRGIDDLPGHHMLGVGPGSLGGWQVAAEVLHDAGIDPERDLASLNFTGMPHDQVVEGVLAGTADAGTVRTGILEQMASEGRLDPAALRLLAPREIAGFPLHHSTRLYPEWPFSRMPHTPDALAEAATIALLEMPDNHPAAFAGGYQGWSAPLSYGPVHELFRKLEVAPYDSTGPLTMRHYWEEHPEYLFAGLAAILLLVTGVAARYHHLAGALRQEVSRRGRVEGQLREHQQRLAHQANHDYLTDLPNRMLLTTRLEQAMASADRSGGRVAVLFLDLDRFKNINDSLGHSVGDDLLQILGSRLRHRLPDHTVARLGGDEFIVLLERADDNETVAAFARQLIGLVSEPFAVGGWQALNIGSSIGISLYPDDAASAPELITHADAAMYHAKESGRNTYSFYTQALTDSASQRLDIEARLRRALRRGEMTLHYQPQVAMDDGRITGVEALVRWQDPAAGLIPPDRFIPVAEESGLIEPLGSWVLREACRQLREWSDVGLDTLEMSVNLSAHQIANPALPYYVAEVLEEYDLAPQRLFLELTESALMTRGEQAVEVIQRLKAVGVGLAIDDFGTGYSSLAYLKRFAIDILKIDRCFVQDLPDDRDDVEIASTIIAMARNLNLAVLAEGVENEAQRAFLAGLKCDAWQGFFRSRPLPADEFLALYRG